MKYKELDTIYIIFVETIEHVKDIALWLWRKYYNYIITYYYTKWIHNIVIC